RAALRGGVSGEIRDQIVRRAVAREHARLEARAGEVVAGPVEPPTERAAIALHGEEAGEPAVAPDLEEGRERARQPRLADLLREARAGAAERAQDVLHDDVVRLALGAPARRVPQQRDDLAAALGRAPEQLARLDDVGRHD